MDLLNGIKQVNVEGYTVSEILARYARSVFECGCAVLNRPSAFSIEWNVTSQVGTTEAQRETTTEGIRSNRLRIMSEKKNSAALSGEVRFIRNSQICHSFAIYSRNASFGSKEVNAILPVTCGQAAFPKLSHPYIGRSVHGVRPRCMLDAEYRSGRRVERHRSSAGRQE